MVLLYKWKEEAPKRVNDLLKSTAKKQDENFIPWLCSVLMNHGIALLWSLLETDSGCKRHIWKIYPRDHWLGNGKQDKEEKKTTQATFHQLEDGAAGEPWEAA
jgi:hypothetical protein